ncbi:hypothetical protein [Paraburkholderia sp. LEh10]|uniref:hypothetical protein n=1 Tax=Paraburkholderia sp. LEh10 TaxID=2821353 RepID=UPI001FD7B060|nr:hypothetical protein [Paraburkholderia sp. LEh10]
MTIPLRCCNITITADTIDVPGALSSSRMQISMLRMIANAALNACRKRGKSSFR